MATTPGRGRLSIERVQEAARIIDPVFLRTPQFLCEPLGDSLGMRVALKIETLNPIRSFKGRGAEYLVSQLAGENLVCASAGNFGQAMAYSCRKRSLPLVVYAAVNANPLKVERMRALGAQVRRHGEDFDAAKVEAKRVAAQSGARLVEDGLEPATAEGAGTIGLEWLEFPESLDALLVSLGNGALLSGVALVLKERSPRTRIIAVQAAGAPAMIESWRADRVIVHGGVDTIADGIGVRVPIREALDDLRGSIDDALLVGEEEIVEGMRLLHRHAGVVAEPSGAVGVAALRQHGEMFRGRLVGTIVCGGNLTPDGMRQWLQDTPGRGRD
ncbi:MAG TPA: threonine/serine dehydratase [Vicinamibacteria bacterium]|nr:threonine/serine dehydratase [Vicinamibacteria bacterium]